MNSSKISPFVNGPQLSGIMSWTFESFKPYDWYPGQKYLKLTRIHLKLNDLSMAFLEIDWFVIFLC